MHRAISAPEGWLVATRSGSGEVVVCRADGGHRVVVGALAEPAGGGGLEREADLEDLLHVVRRGSHDVEAAVAHDGDQAGVAEAHEGLASGTPRDAQLLGETVDGVGGARDEQPAGHPVSDRCGDPVGQGRRLRRQLEAETDGVTGHE